MDGSLIVTTQTISAQPALEWYDDVVFVFSFTDRNGNKQFSGCVHIQIRLASAQGSNTQASQLVTAVNQQQIQFSSDPGCWIDTLKNAARNKTSINIVYDDAVDKPYTTLTNQSFPLQQLFSLAG
jgi:hypothetical protein